MQPPVGEVIGKCAARRGQRDGSVDSGSAARQVIRLLDQRTAFVTVDVRERERLRAPESLVPAGIRDESGRVAVARSDLRGGRIGGRQGSGRGGLVTTDYRMGPGEQMSFDGVPVERIGLHLSNCCRQSIAAPSRLASPARRGICAQVIAPGLSRTAGRAE